MKIKKTNNNHIAGIKFVEFDRYAKLYKEHPHKKIYFAKTLQKRISIAQDWMWVVIEDDKVLGSLSAQPTRKRVEDFTSWEDSTDNGTLATTYDESGSNVYVVNLDVLREGTKKGAQYMLMAHLAAKIIRENKQTVFFESRMPGLREWYIDEKGKSEKDWYKLSDDEKYSVAEEYATLTTEKNGVVYAKDRLLSFYDKSGFKAYKVALNAFEDPESLDCGVVFYADNPLPRLLRVFGVRHFIAFCVRLFSRNPKILDLLT